MKDLFYNRKFLFCIKIISLICVIFLTSVEVYNFLTQESLSSPEFIQNFIENIISIFCFAILSLYPHKLELLAFPSFIYAIDCLALEVNNPIGILMYALGNVVLYVRGFFLRNTRVKIFITIILYIFLLLSGLYFGQELFLELLINKLGYTLVLLIILFLLFNKICNLEPEKNQSQRILNLANFQGLRKDDVILLQKVLDNKQYKEISCDVLRTEGTVRNRLNKVYDILGVMDKMGFVTKYTGYEIIYKTQDEILATSDNQKVNSKSEEELYSELYDKLSSIFKKKK
ncbi:MAG: hypothetical protein IJ688_03710 [Treponema sp.]|nr:hypothetical protein [Treponema sp.]